MRKQKFSVDAKLLIFKDMVNPWTYVLIPDSKVPRVMPGGWGSIPVQVKLGKTKWKTSIFPLKDVGYFLPIKKKVREKEGVKAGDIVSVEYKAI